MENRVTQAIRSRHILDGCVHNVGADNIGKLAAWASASHVEKAPKKAQPDLVGADGFQPAEQMGKITSSRQRRIFASRFNCRRRGFIHGEALLHRKSTGIALNKRRLTMTTFSPKIYFRTLFFFFSFLFSLTAYSQQLKFITCGTKPLPLQLLGAQPKALDYLCGNTGCHKSDANDRQNEAKNNLCADTTRIVPLTMADFSSLNQKTEEILGMTPIDERPTPPEDRTRLRQIVEVNGQRIGEGDVVSFVAFVVSTRHSNVDNSKPLNRGSGESVNCNYLGCAYNDIHIEMNTKKADSSHCDRISAEIIPHYRPASWERFDSEDYTSYLRNHPVRITGHLFYDGSHRPCKNGQSQNDMSRFSSWEIHPVYAIEVCRGTEISTCNQNSSLWFPFTELKGVLGLSKIRPTAKCLSKTNKPCTKCNATATCASGTGAKSKVTRKKKTRRSRSR